MDSNKSNWIKKIGIVGFLFFLIKGILWLVFGAAALKWLQNIFALFFIMGLSVELKIHAQYSPYHKKDKLVSTENKLFVSTIEYKVPKQNLFCNWEHKLDHKLQIPIAFRLGNLAYTRSLEYPFVYNHFTTE